MHICYLDESGNPQNNPGTTPYFVLLGMAIAATDWRQKDAEITRILNAHNLYGEMHTAWMARPYAEQERIPGFAALNPGDRRAAVQQERKKDLGAASLRGDKAVRTLKRNFQKTEAYTHLTFAERVAILQATADAIGGWGDMVLFADAQQKAANVGAEERILDNAFEQVVTRFHHYMERKQVDLGMLVQDQNQTAALRLTHLARRYHAGGTRYIEVPRLVETPLFVDSRLTSMVQLADLAAYALRRYFENGETDLLDRLYSRFDRDERGRLVGIRHYTGKQACNCRICVDHGRGVPRPRRFHLPTKKRGGH
jgi:hypothetical protein